MAIPDYESLMLPILKIAEDGKERVTRDYTESLAKQFNVTPDEQAMLTPAGLSLVFQGRVNWAITYMFQAKLLDRTARATYKISLRGLELLKANPEYINSKILRQFPEFLDFQRRSTKDKENVDSGDIKDVNPDIDTPQEAMDQAYSALRNALATDILSKVKTIAPAQFEQLVIELLVKMGYGGSFKDASQVTGKSGDGGIDGVIKEDRLGLDVIYVQAKRWQNIVGRPEIQNFVGALAGHGAKKGVFITTSSFSKEAREYQPKNETKIVLLDGDQLANLMIDFNLGVSTVTTYEIKRMDSDYFEED